MNRLVVYVGPTLSAAEVRDLAPEADIQPPVEGGSLLRERFASGDVVLIIDGYYRDRPAVRHKEIMHLLDQGVEVVGAASMGALRAAELDRYGMRGVGRVYEMYRTGEVWGDDEVAVRHLVDSAGYEMTSIALVNLRYACHRAVEARVATGETARHLITAAKSLVFDERTWPAITEVACRGRTPAQVAEAERLIDHIRQGGPDIKADDARLAVGTARDLWRSIHDRAGTDRPTPAGPPPAAPPDRRCAPTVFLSGWLTYWPLASVGPSRDWVSDVDVLDAARLYFADYPAVHQQVLAGLLAEAAGKDLGPDATVSEYVCRHLGLRDGTVLPARLLGCLSAEERQLPVTEQATLLAIRVWPTLKCIEWRPAVIARLRSLPSWQEWRWLVEQADLVRRGGGPQVPEKVAGLLFLRKWGVSGPSITSELARRGFLSLHYLNQSAARFAGFELRQQQAGAAPGTAKRCQRPPAAPSGITG